LSSFQLFFLAFHPQWPTLLCCRQHHATWGGTFNPEQLRVCLVQKQTLLWRKFQPSTAPQATGESTVVLELKFAPFYSGETRGGKVGTIPRAPITMEAPQSPMSQVLSSIHHSCFGKTSGSNMRASSFLPRALSSLVTPLKLKHSVNYNSIFDKNLMRKQAVTSLGHQEWRRVFWGGPSFLNYAQCL